MLGACVDLLVRWFCQQGSHNLFHFLIRSMAVLLIIIFPILSLTTSLFFVLIPENNMMIADVIDDGVKVLSKGC